MATQKTIRLLEPFLLGSEQPNGDIDARCPLHDDKKRSARINFKKNVWICFAGCGQGSLAGLLKRMRENGEAVSSTPKRQPVASINPKIVEAWHESLMSNENQRSNLWLMRGISEETIKRFTLGWDQASRAFSIPVYLEDGRLFNIRMYRPDAPSDRKIYWFRKKDPNIPVPLYPVDMLIGTDWVVLCEGEMDALLANQYGIPAVTGTSGASSWHVDWSERFRDKFVFIAYDRDTAGERGSKLVAEHLEPFASKIHIVRIPLRKKGADVSDLFLNKHYTAEDFKDLLRKSKPYQKRVQDPMLMEPNNTSVMDSFDGQNVGRALGMDVLISGRAPEPYSVPKVVTSKCTMDAGPKCKLCPMLAKKGEHTFEVSPSSPSLLSMIGGTKTAVHDSLRETIGAVKCDRLQHEVKTHQTVEQLYVRPSWDETSGDFTPRRVNSVGKHNTMPSQVVHVIGTTWPDPKEQHNQFLAWDVAEAENAIDEFRVTPDVVRDLKQFRPRGGQTSVQKLYDVATDMEQHVTRIYGRRDLHIAVDLVFHSITAFPFQGKLERRGWLDALVVGDTRTGKSEVAQRMLEHYGTGQFVNCEAATFAGIIGGLQQMADKQWAITWGIVPMSDRRLVVLDEASGLSPEEIAKMSDVRSRGIIRMQKIQSEQAWARTRLLWLSNPRNESMDEYTYGVEAIQPLIGNREDIARFDFAMALNSHDVDMDDIYQAPSSKEPKYDAHSCHQRVLWAWSRKEENIEWDTGVEHDVLARAEWLGEQYVSSPPLLQPANAHVKLARLAVAFASATFSTESSGKHIIVRREHVVDATRFLHYLYSKETFGYKGMSQRHLESLERAQSHMDEAKRFLLENNMLIMFLQQSHGHIMPDMIEKMLNISQHEGRAITNQLMEWGMLSLNSTGVKINPALHSLLREIERDAR